ncbi:unnamed protein product, partial [Prorocentrum cordatum]
IALGPLPRGILYVASWIASCWPQVPQSGLWRPELHKSSPLQALVVRAPTMELASPGVAGAARAASAQSPPRRGSVVLSWAATRGPPAAPAVGPDRWLHVNPTVASCRVDWRRPRRWCSTLNASWLHPAPAAPRAAKRRRRAGAPWSS